jgi:hypothetical protein
MECAGGICMSINDDDILVRELGKVGGFLLGRSPVGKVVGFGGSFGARFAAKFLPTETYSEKLALKISPELALKHGFSVLTKLGKLQTDSDYKPPHPSLKAVVGSGFMNLNPAVVCLEIQEANSTGCVLTISAAAKEGLIKQHTAAKAVQRVVSTLRELANAA